MGNFALLVLAILLETCGTALLKVSAGFTRPLPGLVSLMCYGGSLYFLSLCLKTIPVGIAYAIWSALGIVLIALIGTVFFHQVPDLWAIIGFALIIAGVAVLQLCSKMPLS